MYAQICDEYHGTLDSKRVSNMLSLSGGHYHKQCDQTGLSTWITHCSIHHPSHGPSRRTPHKPTHCIRHKPTGCTSHRTTDKPPDSLQRRSTGYHTTRPTTSPPKLPPARHHASHHLRPPSSPPRHPPQRPPLPLPISLPSRPHNRRPSRRLLHGAPDRLLPPTNTMPITDPPCARTGADAIPGVAIVCRRQGCSPGVGEFTRVQSLRQEVGDQGARVLRAKEGAAESGYEFLILGCTAWSWGVLNGDPWYY